LSGVFRDIVGCRRNDTGGGQSATCAQAGKPDRPSHKTPLKRARQYKKTLTTKEKGWCSRGQAASILNATVKSTK